MDVINRSTSGIRVLSSRYIYKPSQQTLFSSGSRVSGNRGASGGQPFPSETQQDGNLLTRLVSNVGVLIITTYGICVSVCVCVCVLLIHPVIRCLGRFFLSTVVVSCSIVLYAVDFRVPFSKPSFDAKIYAFLLPFFRSVVYKDILFFFFFLLVSCSICRYPLAFVLATSSQKCDFFCL